MMFYATLYEIGKTHNSKNQILGIYSRSFEAIQEFLNIVDFTKVEVVINSSVYDMDDYDDIDDDEIDNEMSN